MTWATIVDPEHLTSSATHTAACLGELESHLKALVGAQDEMQVAVTGATGQAIYNALGNSHEKGRELAVFLQTIVDNMKEANVKLDSSDLDAAGQVNFDMGNDGAVDTGTGTGTWNNGVQEKVDTSSWA